MSWRSCADVHCLDRELHSAMQVPTYKTLRSHHAQALRAVLDGNCQTCGTIQRGCTYMRTTLCTQAGMRIQLSCHVALACRVRMHCTACKLAQLCALQATSSYFFSYSLQRIQYNQSKFLAYQSSRSAVAHANLNCHVKTRSDTIHRSRPQAPHAALPELH